jgi:hypothetical protein
MNTINLLKLTLLNISNYTEEASNKTKHEKNTPLPPNRPLLGLLYQPYMVVIYECGIVAGMIIRGNRRSTWKKTALVPLCPP